MGIFPRLEINRPLAVPDTPPPELGSPGPSFYTSKPLEDRAWKPAVPISPPMSSYDPTTKPDRPAGKSLDVMQLPRDSQQAAPRQQLPSLSSLFGPPNSIRPVHSPLSDRPSPLYSPLDRPRSASINRERSISSSYFPNVPPPVTQARSAYEPRPEQDRPSLLPAVLHFPGPLSPRPRDAPPTQSEQMPHSRWSAQSLHQENRRSEYVLGSQEPGGSFRAVNDRLPFPPMGHKLSHDSTSGSSQLQLQTVGAAARSPPPSAGVVSEGLPAKDGLGPKIWTGTHFLPRFVRQAEVPGEGLCYFYDDGTHCKTVIDGEQVNAHWGVTKAGKPRKRLAIACLTCREKKIKCDPDFPRCVQCEKFGRVCKFKNAPRGGHNTSPVTSPGVHEESRQLGPVQRSVDLKRPRSSSSNSLSPRAAANPGHSPDSAALGSKRIRIGLDHYQPAPSEPAGLYQAPDLKRAGLPSWQPREVPRVHEDALRRSWHADHRPHAPL